MKLIRELRLEIERLKGIIRSSEKTGDQVGGLKPVADVNCP